ncbi:MAG: KTSC domain-containing protein [Hyphomicrobiaceae bacterium]
MEFLNGTIYQYFNVPLNMYEQLMREGQKGDF